VRVLQPVPTTQLRWIARRPFFAAPTFGSLPIGERRPKWAVTVTKRGHTRG
jgi:hypothetical protein